MKKNDGLQPLIFPAILTAILGGRMLWRHVREADLHGQTVLITGGTRGLGFLLARDFAREGCRIAICGRDEIALQEARQELERLGVEVLAVPCDVADRRQVADLIDRVTAHYGQIDILVNNAGVIQVGPLETMALSDFEHAINVILWGTIYPTLGTLPQMLARGQGRIVNITSIGGKLGVPHLLPYSTAKYGTVGFSQALHAEMAPRGIKVTTVVPGLMRTGSHLNALFKGQEDEEFTWFGLGATLPLISIDAERAAQQIVRATKRGEAEWIITLPASFIARFNGLFPGITTRLLSLANQIILPEAPGPEQDRTRGVDISRQLESALARRLMAWGRSAGRRFNQYATRHAVEQHPGLVEELRQPD